MKSLRKFDNYSDYTNYIDGEDVGKYNVSFIRDSRFVKYKKNNGTQSSTIIWVDSYYPFNEIEDFIADPEEKGSNCYIYINNTIQRNGTTYYVWQLNSGSQDTEPYGILLTTTIDFDTLYGESLEDDPSNTFDSFVERCGSDFTTLYDGSHEEFIYLIKVERRNNNGIQIWIDDFEYGPALIAQQMANPDEEGVPKYMNNGETITYQGNTYYLWTMMDTSAYADKVKYILTTTNNVSTLYGQSLETNMAHQFSSFVAILNSDNEEYEPHRPLQLLKVEGSQQTTPLRIWVDDFYGDYNNDQDRQEALDSDDYQAYGANPYIYNGDTVEYNGDTYFLWEADHNLSNESQESNVPYIATSSADFNTLYGQSLESSLSAHFTSCVGMLSDDKTMYNPQSTGGEEGDTHTLIKVERI